MANIDPNDPFSRQFGYVDRDAVGPILLAGCGSVGRQIGLALGAMGFGAKLQLWDADDVDGVNLATQGWPAHAVGQAKTEFLADEIERNGGHRPQSHKTFYHGAPSADVIITALDSIAARRAIVERLAQLADAHLQELPRLIVDPRQGPTGCVIVCVQPSGGEWLSRYLTTLPPKEDDAGCVRPQTYFQSLITAGIACQQIIHLSMGRNAECHVLYDGSDSSITDLIPKAIPAPPKAQH